MNIDFEIEKLVPHFLLNDTNGYAIAKAIEKAWQLAAKAAQDGIDTIQDADKMPEWRLDEMAKEYNIPYDFTAPIDVKRKWIKDAYDLSRIYGTVDGMSKYLSGYFDDAEVAEASEYGGSPFHFKMDMYGSLSEEKLNWATKAIQETKNVRSVLDQITFHLPDVNAKHELYVGLALYGTTTQEYEATEQPIIDPEEFLADESAAYLVDENTVAMTD